MRQGVRIISSRPFGIKEQGCFSSSTFNPLIFESRAVHTIDKTLLPEELCQVSEKYDRISSQRKMSCRPIGAPFHQLGNIRRDVHAVWAIQQDHWRHKAKNSTPTAKITDVSHNKILSKKCLSTVFHCRATDIYQGSLNHPTSRSPLIKTRKLRYNERTGSHRAVPARGSTTPDCSWVSANALTCGQGPPHPRGHPPQRGEPPRPPRREGPRPREHPQQGEPRLSQLLVRCS